MNVRERQRVGELTALIGALAVYGGVLLHDRHPLPASPLPWGDQGAGRIVVEVAGGGGAKGIYFLPEATAAQQLSEITGSRLSTAEIRWADARRSFAAAYSVSLEKGELHIAPLSAEKRLALGLPIDVNRATEEELMLVPGIGEQTAARIVRLRGLRGGFGRVEDLTAVPGIKEKKLRTLEKYLTAGPGP